jgi:DNA replication protein DnaD
MLQMSGWIKLDREITSHWIFEDSWKFRNWIDLLTLVNHSEQKVNIKGTVLTCYRGQTLCSLDTFARRWKCDKSKVRRFLKLLEDDSMIELKSEHITTRLTICKYDTYQGDGNADETKVKRKRNADETQTTPNKNDNKEKNEKELILDSWIDYRKSIRKALSQATINTILKKMESYSNEQCKFVINKSIEMGWQGLFWDKVQTIEEVNEPNKWKAPWN